MEECSGDLLKFWMAEKKIQPVDGQRSVRLQLSFRIQHRPPKTPFENQ